MTSSGLSTRFPKAFPLMTSGTLSGNVPTRAQERTIGNG